MIIGGPFRANGPPWASDQAQVLGMAPPRVSVSRTGRLQLALRILELIRLAVPNIATKKAYNT